jgi:GT2 family glycosyltransferase
MVACAESDPAIGVVGPKSNQTTGPQRMPAIGYDPVSLKGLDPFAVQLSERHAGKSLPHWKVVGFCLLVKRQVVDRIGGLILVSGSARKTMTPA